jgi:hypothetical protein
MVLTASAVLVLDSVPTHLSVQGDSTRTRAIVSAGVRRGKEFTCGSCTDKGRWFCKHIGALQDFLGCPDNAATRDDPAFERYGFKADATRWAPVVPAEDRSPVSSYKISLDSLAPGFQASIRGHMDARPSKCLPPRDPCQKCSGKEWDDMKLARPGTLYGPYSCKEVDVYNSTCGSCGHVRHYEGSSDGIFNLSNETLFMTEIFTDFLNMMASGSPTFGAYHGLMTRRYARSENSKFCSLPTFVLGVWGFIGNIDIDFDASFTCPVCSKLPARDQVLIVDAKTIGHHKTLKTLRNVVDEPVPGVDVLKGTVFSYIQSPDIRMTLRRLAGLKLAGQKDERTIAGLRAKTRTVLPELCEALGFFHGSLTSFPEDFKDFFADISTAYPICTVFRYKDIEILKSVTRTPLISDADKVAMMAAFPSIYRIVSAQKWTSVPDIFKPLFDKLVEVSSMVNAFGSRDADFLPISRQPLNDPFTFIPGHPKIRVFPDFPGDATNDADRCRKIENKHQSHRTPGLMTGFCPHGVCVFLHLMQRFEGPTMLLKLLYEHYEEIPGTLVYDNCCNFSVTALKRLPTLFSTVEFYMDRTHQLGHVGCHSGYNIRKYDNKPILAGAMTMRALNTQCCEQANSRLDTIEKQVGAMSEEHYMHFMKLFVHFMNKKKMENIAV